MMNDPSNFGMAKSFFAMGQAAGYDMTTQAGMNAFMLAYNTGLVVRRSLPEPSLPRYSFFDPPSGLDPAKKKKHKQAEQAQKRNRKRRK